MLGHRALGSNQHIQEYKDKIAHRLEYLRTKRHSMAHEHYSPNKDILLQSIGSAVNLHEARTDEQVKEVLEDRQRAADAIRAHKHFRNKSYSVSQDPRY